MLKSFLEGKDVFILTFQHNGGGTVSREHEDRSVKLASHTFHGTRGAESQRAVSWARLYNLKAAPTFCSKVPTFKGFRISPKHPQLETNASVRFSLKPPKSSSYVAYKCLDMKVMKVNHSKNRAPRKHEKSIF